jgi:hypothetical protein
MISEDIVDNARRLFEYRERATNRRIPHNPDWPRVIAESVKPALDGARGVTSQEQCAYQAIRLAEWQSGRAPLPWTKAFLPTPIAEPIIWYRRWWIKIAAWFRSTVKRLNGDLL